MSDTCGATNRNDEPCGLPAGWGTGHVGDGRCKLHGGSSPRGEDSPSYKHGGYSKYLSEDNFTDDESERAGAIFGDLQDPETARDVGRAMAMDLYVRYDRTKDPRYSREFRQFCETFGFAPEEIQRLAVEHSGRVDHGHELTDRQLSHLDHLTDGPEDVPVEVVEDATR